MELVIWKSKIDERTDGIIDMKMECRIDSLSMVVIIVPYVLSFVTDDSEVDDVVDGDDDDDSNGLIGTTMMTIATAVIWTTMMTVVKTTMYLIFRNHIT